jgi:DNA invertase Pin-like site-specific DNA recombinase
MKEYFGYVRVSTQKQGTQGVSLGEQREAIERYARSRDLTLRQWFEEHETAAKRGRPTFAAMMTELRAGKASGVIIHKIDRSARNLRDWADLGELIDAGVEVHFSAESLDLTSRGGRLSADIQAVVAADFIRNLREETKKGLYGRLKQGLYPLKAPLGYLDCGKGKPKIPDPERAPLVRQAFELYATGAYDLRRLRAELHARGLRGFRGGAVSMNGVNKMLRNPFYVGIMRVGPESQTFRGVHEPLISSALFDRVQAILDGKLNGRAVKHEFLFRRILKCASCGRSLIGERQKGRVYYRCHTPECPRLTVREDAVEALVLRDLTPMELSEVEYEELISALGDLLHDAETRREEVLQGLQLGRAQIDERLGRLTDALVDGLLDKAAYQERREALLREARALDDRIAETQTSPTGALDRVRDFLEQSKSLRMGYESALTEEKRTFLKSATSNCVVHGKRVEIQWLPEYQALAERPKVDECDPTGNRTPISAVKGPRPNR